MADFKVANQKTKIIEGELANSSPDWGKLTYRGIASAFWPDWDGWPAIRKALAQANNNIQVANRLLLANTNLQNRVDNFYKGNFWDVYSLDKVNDQSLADELFDSAVNLGISVEGKLLQRALNLTNLNGRLYADLLVDGVIGPQTIITLNQHPHKPLLLKTLNILQGARYIAIMESNPSQEMFCESWFSRVHI